MRFEIVEVERFPADIKPGALYWSREFKMCAHRCACGCGDVIQLPVDDLNFRIIEDNNGVTLRPSVGNWNICDAHYYITGGDVEWLPKLSPAQIAAGRGAEDARREAFYARRQTWQVRLRSWLARAHTWFLW